MSLESFEDKSIAWKNFRAFILIILFPRDDRNAIMKLLIQ